MFYTLMAKFAFLKYSHIFPLTNTEVFLISILSSLLTFSDENDLKQYRGDKFFSTCFNISLQDTITEVEFIFFRRRNLDEQRVYDFSAVEIFCWKLIQSKTWITSVFNGSNINYTTVLRRSWCYEALRIIGQVLMKNNK